MRVLLVADSYPPAPGGTALHVERLARNLVERGHSVAVVAGGTVDDVERRDGVDCHTCTLRLAAVPGLYVDPTQPFVPPWADSHLVRRVVEVGTDLRPDVVHAHGWSEVAADRAARRLGVPLVVTLHDYGLVCPQKSLFRDGGHCPHFAGAACARCPGSNQSGLKRLALAGALRRRRLPPTTRYLAVSSHVAEMHRRARPECDPPVVANFVDLPGSPVSPLPARPVALFVGPDEPYKGAEVFREAHRLLDRQGWEGTFVHAGGHLADRDRADRDRADLGVGYRSLGRLDHAAVTALYDDCSVFVAPALYPDPCPTVVIEALAAGRPVVASRTGGHTDLVDDSCGVIVETGDAGQLAQAVARLCAAPERLAAMGQQARRRSLHFSSEQVVPQVVAHYEEVVAARAARP